MVAQPAFPVLGLLLLGVVAIMAGGPVGWGIFFFGIYMLRQMHLLALKNHELQKRLTELDDLVTGRPTPMVRPIVPPAFSVPPVQPLPPVQPQPVVAPVARPLVPTLPPAPPMEPTDWESMWRSVAGPLVSAGGGDSANTEARIGAVWFSRIGALLMLIGAIVGYTLLENSWLQAVIGWAAGAGLIGLGALGNRRGYRHWAQAVTGAGLGVLYVVTTAAATIFDPPIMPIPVAFGLMVLITVLGTALAVRYDSIALGLLGMVGGFATPFLLSSGEGSFQVLFTYVAILDLGLMGVAWFKRWPLYNYLLFAATWIIYGAWRGAAYTPADSGWALLFATIFFAIFAGVTVQYNLLHRVKSQYEDLGLVLVNGFVYFASGLELIAGRGLRAEFAFAMATLYLGLAYAARRRNPQDRMLQVMLVGLFGIFLTVAFPVALDGPWIAIAWALQAACFVWAGFVANEPAARIGGGVTFGIAAVRLMIWETYPDWFGLTFPPMVVRAFTFGMSIAAFYLAVWAYRRFRGEVAVLGALAGAASFLTLWYVTLEITIGFDGGGNEAFAVGTAWGLYGLLMALADVRVNHVWLRHGARIVAGAGMVLLASLSFFTVTGDIAAAATQWRWGGYAATIGAIWLMEYLFRRRQVDADLNGTLSLVATVAGFGVGMVEVPQGFGTVALWGAYSLSVMLVGLRLRSVATRLLASGLFGVTMLYTLTQLLNLAGPAEGRVLAFVLLVGGIYLAAWLVRRGESGGGAQELQVTEWLALGAAAFTLVWLSAEVGGDRAFLMSAMWGVYGFLVLAAGFLLRHRRTRFLAIGIVGLTIAKIGLYDLWQLAVVGRIWIAVGVGSMMLLASLAYQRFAKVIMGEESKEAPQA